MTKKELRTLAIGGGFGLGAIFALWYWARRTQTVPVINPAVIQWEPH